MRAGDLGPGKSRGLKSETPLQGCVLAVVSLVVLVSLRGFALDPSKSLTQYSRHSWGTESGLLQNDVNALCQTRDGYIWLGTQEGLVRFDGVRFVTFTRYNTPDLRENFISVLLEDRQGALWIGTTGGGLVRMAGGAFSCLTRKDGLESDIVSALAEGPDGKLWVGTSRGISCLRGGKLMREAQVGFLPHDSIRTLFAEGDGTLWAGLKGGLYRLRNGQMTAFTKRDGLPSDAIWTISGAGGGGLWIGTEGGGYARYDGKSFQAGGAREGLPSETVWCLHEDRQGSLWIGTRKGLSRMRDGRITSFPGEEGLAQTSVWSLLEDREGSLWMGTTSGLFRLEDGAFTCLTTGEGLSRDRVLAVCGDGQGAMWMGTYEGGLNRYKDGIFTRYTTKEGLPGASVYSLCPDRQGNLWIGAKGLCRMAGGKFTCYSKREGLLDENVWCIIEGRDGVLWIGTGGGLNRMEGGKLNGFTTGDGLSCNDVMALCEDREGTLWIGTYGGGLNAYKGGKFTAYTTKEGLSNDIVYTIRESGDGTLWIGTHGGGLNRLKNGKFTAYTTRSGFFNDNVYQILEDGLGNLWMTCNSGVFRASLKDLEGFAEGRKARVACAAYGRADWMKSGECNGGFQPAGWRAQDGRLWFPTVMGVAFVNPAEITTSQVTPPVRVEQLTVDNRPIPIVGKVRIPPGSRDFEFHFTALSFLAPERVLFRYRLEGYSREWVEAGTRRTAYFTNLPPGRYTFRVKACNKDGAWNEAGAALSFVIEPYFYQEWWFYGLCALLAAAVTAVAYRLRLRQLRARQVELESLVAQRTRDLEVEKGKSEDLLLNILPAELVKELKEKGRTTPRTFERASILFTDFKGFTVISATLPAESLVHELNEIFSHFDEVIARHGLEKIKTIGDAYLIAGGLPKESDEHALNCIRCALEMQAFIEERNRTSPLKWSMRAGIHSGSVVAGVVGRRKFTYDVWGDTVNIASRMEQSCEAGRVNISAFTFYLVQGRAECEYRGKVEIKGKGEVDMYYVNSLLPENRAPESSSL